MATRFAEALKIFKFPQDLRNDLIYCQRALKTHLKVHQMIVDQYQGDGEVFFAKQDCLEELENEIYEINAEQQYLLLRTRRIIDEFFKTVQRGDIGVDRGLMNDFISRQVVPYIQNAEYVCVPNSVRARCTESQLFNSFMIPCKMKPAQLAPVSPGAVIGERFIRQNSPESPPRLTARQVSLLKPFSERVVVPQLVRQRSVPEIIIPDNDRRTPPRAETELPVSSKVKMSRLNLRHALSKAAAARNIIATMPAAPVVTPPAVAPAVAAPKVVKAVEAPAKKPQAKATKSDPSSSDDSLDVRMPSPPQLDAKTQPDDYSQDTFLSMFNLYSQEQIQLMQQRRSKRKRRNVHNNEKADFHYGRIDHVLSPQPCTSKKRKKEFLLSPRVNRALKKKPSEDTERSNSSSPDEKSLCSECLKRGGPVIQCKECPNNFHENCHKDPNIRQNAAQCPACARKLSTAQQQPQPQQPQQPQQDEGSFKKENRAPLEDQMRDLEKKLASEQKRRKLLQSEGKMYKIGMRNLIDIVQKFQSCNHE